jgi:hypothetical protein
MYRTLQIKGKFRNTTFVNVYAPTEGTEDEIVDEFYETLHVCDEIPKYDASITLGDFNTKFVMNIYIKTSLEPHLYHKTNTRKII